MQSRRVVRTVAGERTPRNERRQSPWSDKFRFRVFNTRPPVEDRGKSCQVNHKDRPTFRGTRLGGYVICHVGCARNPKPIFSASQYCRNPAFSAFVARLEISHKSTVKPSDPGGSGRWRGWFFFCFSCWAVDSTCKNEMNLNFAGFKYLLGSTKENITRSNIKSFVCF